MKMKISKEILSEIRASAGDLREPRNKEKPRADLGQEKKSETPASK